MLKNIKNLLGGGNKKEFFLELDDAKGVPAAEPKMETSAPEKPAEVAQPEVVASEVAEVSAQPVETQKSKKKSVKKAAKKEATKTEIVRTSSVMRNSQVEKKEEPTEVEFATKFFMPSTPRRRPGPSLNTFKNMATQVKVPRG